MISTQNTHILQLLRQLPLSHTLLRDQLSLQMWEDVCACRVDRGILCMQ